MFCTRPSCLACLLMTDSPVVLGRSSLFRSLCTALYIHACLAWSLVCCSNAQVVTWDVGCSIRGRHCVQCVTEANYSRGAVSILANVLLSERCLLISSSCPAEGLMLVAGTVGAAPGVAGVQQQAGPARHCVHRPVGEREAGRCDTVMPNCADFSMTSTPCVHPYSVSWLRLRCPQHWN